MIRTHEPRSGLAVRSFLCMVGCLAGTGVCREPASGPAAAERPRAQERERDSRVESLRALCERLGVGEGAAIADIGCGRGHDSFVFASVVGEKGVVFAEEISQERLDDVLRGSRERGLLQVVPVLGESSDPRIPIPNGKVDLVYMHHVFHHFAKPRDMLRSILLDLKPGGYLAIADRQEGPLRDRVPLEQRERSHHWTGETFVVRAAREEGFRFHGLLDDLWFEDNAFLLVLQRPEGGEPARADPELPPPPDEGAVAEVLKRAGLEPRESDPSASEENAGRTPTIIVCALDRAREVLPKVRSAAGDAARLLDLVPEEWSSTDDETLPGSGEIGAETIRNPKGELELPEGVTVDRVLFLDGYHRLWDPGPVLKRLREALAPQGRVVVLDRVGPADEPRRVAGHRRRISPDLVRKDFEEAGFVVDPEISELGGDRFLLLFRAPQEPKPEREF